MFGIVVAVAAAAAGLHPWEVRNEYWLVRGRGAVIESALADANGGGLHKARFAAALYCGDSPSFAGTVEKRGRWTFGRCSERGAT
jgi:hypothetical protein